MDKRLQELLEMPPVKWDAYFEANFKDGRTLAEVDEALAGIACHAVMLKGYLRARDEMFKHAAAVKAANRLNVRLRQIFGYTYPEKGQFTF